MTRRAESSLTAPAVDGDLALLAIERCPGSRAVAHAAYLDLLTLYPDRAPECSREDWQAWCAEHVKAGSLRPRRDGRPRRTGSASRTSPTEFSPPTRTPWAEPGNWCIVRHGPQSEGWSHVYQSASEKRIRSRFAKEIGRATRSRVALLDPAGKVAGLC